MTIQYLRPVGIQPWFGYNALYSNGTRHKGLDYAVPIGTAVKATIAGRVSVAGWSTSGFGNHIRIIDAYGVEHIYGHLNSVSVRVGTYVKTGQLIGYSGSSGNSTGPHLHYEVRRGGVAFDPTPYMVYKLIIDAIISAIPKVNPTYHVFVLSLLKPGLNNSEVKLFQQWMWNLHGAGYKTNFVKTGGRDFTRYGFTTFYGGDTKRMVQDLYRYLDTAYPNQGWAAGSYVVNGKRIYADTPGPALFRQYGRASK